MRSLDPHWSRRGARWPGGTRIAPEQYRTTRKAPSCSFVSERVMHLFKHVKVSAHGILNVRDSHPAFPLVTRDLAACAHSGRHYGEQARAVPVARTRAQELVFTGEALMRALPALAPGNLTAVPPLQQGHPGIRTYENSPKGTRKCKEKKKGSNAQHSRVVFAPALPVSREA